MVDDNVMEAGFDKRVHRVVALFVDNGLGRSEWFVNVSPMESSLRSGESPVSWIPTQSRYAHG